MEIFTDICHEILFMALGQLIIFQIVHSMFEKISRLEIRWCGLYAVWQPTEN